MRWFIMMLVEGLCMSALIVGKCADDNSATVPSCLLLCSWSPLPVAPVSTDIVVSPMEVARCRATKSGEHGEASAVELLLLFATRYPRAHTFQAPPASERRIASPEIRLDSG